MTPLSIPAPVLSVLERLKSAGFDAYLAGGFLRDALLGSAPQDCDAATSAKPEQVKRLFADCVLVPTGQNYGTVGVICGGCRVEITTFRSDGTYSDHRRPESVKFSNSAKEDSSRRDFTINALLYDTKVGILDFHGGLEDLKNKCLRCVGEAETRFEEDALRILRALRFASRLGFEIEEKTASAMRKKAPLLRYVSAERVFSELKGFFASANSAALCLRFPTVFRALFGEPQCGAQALAALRDTDDSFRLPAFFALYGGESGAAAIARGVRADRETLALTAAALDAACGNAFADDVCTALTADKYGATRAKQMLSLHRALNPGDGGRAAERLRLMESGALPSSVAALAISGADIAAAGIAAGADIGRTLRHLYARAHLGLPNRKADLLAEARAFAETQGTKLL